MTSGVERAYRYEENVLSGRQPANELTELAVQRSLDERKRTDWEWHFDEGIANACIAWFETLTLTKAAFAGEPFVLGDWQCWSVGNPFGWVSKDTGFRRFRYVYLELPRKNGKSELSAPVALKLLADDDEKTPEVYIAATSKEQASIVYDRANKMVQASDDLRDYYGLRHYGSQFSDQVMHCGLNDGILKPVAWTPDKLDGFHIHGAIIDEFHAHPNDKMWSVIETGTSARNQPMVWAITTAGTDIGGICFQRRRYMTRILRGQSEGERVFGCIWSIEWDSDDKAKRDNWQDESTWAKANPNLGVSVDIADLRIKAAAAKDSNSALPAFLTKHLNVWLRGAHAWMQMDKYAACEAAISWEEFKDCEVWIGLDIADTKDICALCYLFKRADKLWLKWRNYLPAATVDTSKVAQMKGWAQDKYVTEVPGAVMPYSVITEQIKNDMEMFQVQKIGYDPWKAKQLVAHLDAEYNWVEMVKVPQTGHAMSDITRRFEALVVSKGLVVDRNPAVSWMFSNVITVPLPNDNIRPDKPEPEARIDAAIAAIIAMAVAVQDMEELGTGVDTLLDEDEDARELATEDW